jgi:hypothetical protein
MEAVTAALSVRPARQSDLPDCHPQGTSYMAWAVDFEGEPAGVIGLALTRPRACLFCTFDERLRPHLKSLTILRLVKKVEAAFKGRGLPVYAIREKDEPKASAMLKRLGFEPAGELDGHEFYEWRG